MDTTSVNNQTRRWLYPELSFNPGPWRPEHNVLPFWTVNGQIYRTKLEATIAAQHANTWVKFHFNDELLSMQNWTKEPEHDIDYYYRERAQTLRDRYDYIVVMYSGGSDSSTILKTFLKNGIHVDEVATYGIWNKSIDKYYTLDNLEITFSATDMLNWCANAGVKVSHLNLLDGIHLLETDDWIWYSDPLFSASQAVRFPTVYERPEHRELIDKGKSVAIILGHDKPRVLYENGAFHYALCDMGGVGTGIFPQFFDPNYNGPVCELFHTNAAVPELMIKQGHMVLNWYLDNFGVEKSKKLLSPHSLDPNFNSRTNTIIYPNTWNETETYTIGKGQCQSGIGLKINPFSQKLKATEWRSEWLYRDLADTDFNRNWQSGIKRAFDMLEDRYVERDNQKFIGTWSQFYKLADA